MAAPVSFQEEECCSVYWKIKNFSYFCQDIYSPYFSLSSYKFYIRLLTKYSEIECVVNSWGGSKEIVFQTMQLSFLTCDGSPDESITGKPDACLKVQKDVIFGSRRSSFLPEDTLTIRFRCPNRYWKGKLLMSSQIGLKRKCFLWTFKNISKYTSNQVKSCEDSNNYGRINLTLKYSVEQTSVEVSRSGGSYCNCVYTIKIFVYNVDGKTLNELSDTYVFQDTSLQIRGFPPLIKNSKWLARKNEVLPEDTLSLKCIFTMSVGLLIDDGTDINYFEFVAPLLEEPGDFPLHLEENSNSDCVTELQNGLKSMLEEGKLFDAKLKIGSEIIQIHKIVLSARSPVFKAMFTKDMKESINNTVIIEDLDIETVRRFVLYMYSDALQVEQWDHIKNLYFAACKYEVQSLKKKCSSLLETNLTINNAGETLFLADLHQDVDLKTVVLNFISDNDSAVFDSDEWKVLEKKCPALVIQSMREIYCNSRFR